MGADGNEVSSGGDKNVPELIVVMIAHLQVY